MIKILQKLQQEPLVSFLLLGFVLYLYYVSVAQDNENTQTKTEISVTPYEIKNIQNEYTKKYQKDMSEEELSLYVQNSYKNKVLLEESTALDLHKSDALIAKKLIQKMEFILLGSVEYKEPSEKELHKYYGDNIKDYSEVDSLSFVHIYFANTQNNMNELYKMLALSEFNAKNIENLGDAFEGEKYYEAISYKEAQEKFGKYFALKLFKLKKGLWHNATYSKYGVHLIYVTEKFTANPYKFDAVEDRVYEDYLREKRDETITKAYKNILDNYTLRLENVSS